MEEIEIVDRNYENVKEAADESKIEKVRLTGKSKSAIDLIFFNTKRLSHKASMLNEEADLIAKSVEKAKNSGTMDAGTESILNFEVTRLRKKALKATEKSKNSYKRAIRVKEFMCKHMLNKAESLLGAVDVDAINIENIADIVENSFEKGTTTTKQTQSPNIDSIDSSNIEKAVDSNIELQNKIDDSITKKAEDTVTTNSFGNTVEDGTYSFTKNDIIQDDISGINQVVSSFNGTSPRNRMLYETDEQYNEFLDKYYNQESSSLKNKESEKNEEVSTDSKGSMIVPEIKAFFENSAIDHILGNESTVEQEKSDLYKDATATLNDSSTTIDDLERLRRALEEERNKKDKLTKELEEKRLAAEIAEKEAEKAEKEKQEKIQLVNDELAQYKKANEALQSQTKQIEEVTQQKISRRQNAMNYIASLDEMIDSSIGKSSDLSINRGGK